MLLTLRYPMYNNVINKLIIKKFKKIIKKMLKKTVKKKLSKIIKKKFIKMVKNKIYYKLWKNSLNKHLKIKPKKKNKFKNL